MSKSEGLIVAFYGDGRKEEQRSEESRAHTLEFHYTKQHVGDYVSEGARVLELGCATGHYAQHFASACREYVGVDLVPSHVRRFQETMTCHGISNASAMLGDARDLNDIADQSFDVALCLGPMYHLDADGRAKVFAECRRVTRPGGVVVFAYINRIGAYVGACVHDEYRRFYPTKEANRWVLDRSTDDVNTDIFHFSMPEEMEQAAAEHGFQKIKNVGTDFFITESIVNAMDDEKFEAYMELADQMASSESCTGMSNHALLICRR